MIGTFRFSFVSTRIHQLVDVGDTVSVGGHVFRTSECTLRSETSHDVVTVLTLRAARVLSTGLASGVCGLQVLSAASYSILGSLSGCEEALHCIGLVYP